MITWKSFNLLIAMIVCMSPPSDDPRQRPASKYVFFGGDGKLTYLEDEKGNRIPDFSHCGYGGGGVAIPEVPVAITLEPRAAGDLADDTPRMQGAIDEVSQLEPDFDGFRGAVLLKKGTYRVGGSIMVRQSGVVLRGEGDGSGSDSTILLATGRKQRSLIILGIDARPREVRRARTQILDNYVPVGARQFRVRSTTHFSVGDRIIVHRPSTAEWIADLGMDRLPPRRDGGRVVQWRPGSKDILFDRIITHIDGQTITIDAPIVCALDQKYGGGTVYKYEFPRRIEQVGIENIRAVCEYTGPVDQDEDHAWSFIDIRAVENVWVRNVTARHFAFAAVEIGRGAKWVTVQDSRFVDPVSQITGSRRYPFLINGQLSLVQRCYARDGRHEFATGAQVAGPNVFLDCFAERSHSDSGPHHRWAVGILYDNIRLPDGALVVQDRQSMGTGHGWAGANHVFWNCVAKKLVSQQPPTAQNWAIGCVGEKHGGVHRREDGLWDSLGQPVQPRSLYLQQLRERLGSDAVRATSRDQSDQAPKSVRSDSSPVVGKRVQFRRELRVCLKASSLNCTSA